MREKITNLLSKHVHFSRFLIVGVANTLLDFTLFFIFANLFGIQPVESSILSTGLTMIMSFYLNHNFVFESAKKKRHTALQFIAITGFNVWLVQSAVIALAIHVLYQLPFFSSHIWSQNLLAKLCGISVSFVLNFIMYRYIFHKKETEELNTL